MNTDQPSWVEKRLLNFLNQAQSAEEIYADENLKDDPTTGSAQGYAIGATTAQNIIDFRESTPSKQFESVEDILHVPGLGEDKLNDLLKSCAVPADDAYIQALFKDLLGDNWEVTPHIIDYSSDDEFDEVANNAENFRRAVATLYSNILSYYSSEAKRELEMRIHKAYQENYEEGHIGSFQLAFWWYLFDQDNWFSYENIRSISEDYLNYHGYGERTMQFRVIHLEGYDSISFPNVSSRLPVVVNYAENRITLWQASLKD